MPTPKQAEKPQKAGRMVLAAQAFRRGQISSIQAAANLYNVPRTSLSHHLRGRVPRVDSYANGHKLTQTEEQTLLNWVLDMDSRGYPPRISAVGDAAKILLEQRVGASAKIGVNWAQRFIKRQPQLSSKYTRAYDYQRAQCEDPEKLRAWFRLVTNMINKYGIVEDDIYNFDEVGYAMGLIGTTRVVTNSDRRGRPVTLQPGDREWVTSIECINSCGWALPPMLIFAGKVHISTWYQNAEIPRDWVIALSDNGWTNDDLGLQWVRTVFDPITTSRTVGTHRLLILDGHGSHGTPEFDAFCKEKNIITLCMPAHSSHLLQPLDVGCFSPLKSAYRRLVANGARVGINHVDKSEFLSIYTRARTETLSASNIRSGFRATGLIPLNAEEVLARLQITVQTPTPPPPPIIPMQWEAETPHNLTELRQQTMLLQGLLRGSHSPPSPTIRAVNQVVKGCQLAMHGAALLASENEQLRIANARQKAKRGGKRAFIATGGILTMEEGADLAQGQIVGQNRNPLEGEALRKTRAKPRCSLCNSPEHKAPQCPSRQQLNT